MSLRQHGRIEIVTMLPEVGQNGRGGTRTHDLTDVNRFSIFAYRGQHGQDIFIFRVAYGARSVMSPVVDY